VYILYLPTYLLNIGIDIATFCRYRIEIEKAISKHHCSLVRPLRKLEC